MSPRLYFFPLFAPEAQWAGVWPDYCACWGTMAPRESEPSEADLEVAQVGAFPANYPRVP